MSFLSLISRRHIVVAENILMISVRTLSSKINQTKLLWLCTVLYVDGYCFDILEGGS